MFVYLAALRRVTLTVFPILVVGSACTTTSGSKASDGGPPLDFHDADFDRFVVEAGGDLDARSEGGELLNRLCGEGSCSSPDDEAACATFGEGGAPPPSADAAPDVTLPEGSIPDASSDAAGSTDAASEASLTEGDGSLFYPTLDAPPSGLTPTEFACQVRREGGKPVHRCEPSGRGERGAPCTSSRDCAPAFGCVGEQGAGQCLRFCCEQGGDNCETGTYCADLPLRDDANEEPLSVPVCVPADDCKLDEVYPCDPSANESCKCSSDETCAVVRGDGTTSCVTPGQGVDGDACPCAAGFFCGGMETCVKVCKTDALEGEECGVGRCQAVANFPMGFGLCVGMTPLTR